MGSCNFTCLDNPIWRSQTTCSVMVNSCLFLFSRPNLTIKNRKLHCRTVQQFDFYSNNLVIQKPTKTMSHSSTGASETLMNNNGKSKSDESRKNPLREKTKIQTSSPTRKHNDRDEAISLYKQSFEASSSLSKVSSFSPSWNGSCDKKGKLQRLNLRSPNSESNLIPITRRHKLERHYSETVLSSDESDFCCGEPTFLSSSLREDAMIATTPPLPKECNIVCSASSSNHILAATVPFAEESVSVRYWPAAIVNNETRVSASSTTWIRSPSDTVAVASASPESPKDARDEIRQLDHKLEANVPNGHHELLNGTVSSDGESSDDGLKMTKDDAGVKRNENDADYPKHKEVADFFNECVASTSGSPIGSERSQQSEPLSPASVAEAEPGQSNLTNMSSTDSIYDCSIIDQLKTLELALARNTPHDHVRIVESSRAEFKIAQEESVTTVNKSSISSGILKMPHPLRISATLNPKPSKAVRFLDSIGKPLVLVQEFDETQELLDKMKIEQEEVEKRYSSTNKTMEDKPLFKFAFEQPGADYMRFRRKLETQFVSLENVRVQGSRSIVGTVKVKNISFEKRVFIRITFNSWGSSSDVICTYVETGIPGATMYDTFRFQVSVPSSWHDLLKIEFCVCFELGDGTQYWDSNAGENYSIVSSNSKLDAMNSSTLSASTVHPADHTSPLFSFWRANTLLDEAHPYW